MLWCLLLGKVVASLPSEVAKLKLKPETHARMNTYEWHEALRHNSQKCNCLMLMILWTGRRLIIISLRCCTCTQFYNEEPSIKHPSERQIFKHYTWTMVRSSRLVGSYGMTKGAVSVPSGSTDFHGSNSVWQFAQAICLLFLLSTFRDWGFINRAWRKCWSSLHINW